MQDQTAPSTSIRLLTLEDAEQLGRLLDGLGRDPEARHFHPHPLTDAEGRRLAASLASIQDLYFGAFVDQRLVGYGMLRGWDEGYAIPSFGVAVEATSRGRGLGRALLRFAIEAARARGAASMILKVHGDNPSARLLYASEGFTFSETADSDGQIRGSRSL